MEPRQRTFASNELMGTVYTMNNGFKEILGTSTCNVEEGSSSDYFRKKAREDKTLPPSPCLIAVHYRDPLRMTKTTGTFRFDGHSVSDQGTILSGHLNGIRPAKDSGPRLAENDLLVQELLAATNPFRYEFSIPVAMKELVDISTLFKIAAKGFFNFVGSNYLNYKFGWVQFVNDLSTLAKITKTIESRIRELQSLSKHGGLRRKRNLRSKSENWFIANQLVNSTWSTTVRVTNSGRHSCQTFGTVRWRFRPGFDVSLNKLQAFNLAVSKVFDLGELDSQTMWNLVPFSWLADYFVDVSDYFGAHLGQDVLEPYDICIVRKSHSKGHFEVTTKPSSVSITGSGNFSRDEYDRDVCSSGSFPTQRVDFLSWSQLSIIAALAASFKR